MKECPVCKHAMERDMEQDGDSVIVIWSCNHCGAFLLEYPYDER